MNKGKGLYVGCKFGPKGILASLQIAIYINQHVGNNKNGKVTVHSVKTCVCVGGGWK